jgi:hypothetical protein
MAHVRWLFLLFLPFSGAGCRRSLPSSTEGSRPTFRYLIRRPPALPAVLDKVRFADIASEAGLNYQWSIPGARPLHILQTIGNGCALLDYNRDGNLDILLIGPRLALYRGEGRLRFTEVTQSTGLASFSGHFLGCAVGDIDGDGYPDLYISGYRAGLLLRNRKGVDFEDRTRQAGMSPQPWGTSCAFAETRPGSGRLDLYVANYVDFDPRLGPLHCIVHNVETSCGPRTYPPLPGVFYRNEGAFRFTDVTRSVGADSVTGKGLGALFFPLEIPGLPALAIANDEMPGDLLVPNRAQGKLHYLNRAQAAGAAFDRDGNVHGGMGIDAGDYDNDGRIDLFVTTYQSEPRSLYHNEGNGLFSDQGIAAGLGAEIAEAVGFGTRFFDYDNDGWLDIVIANGHVQDNVQQIYAHVTYRQPLHLLRNTGGARPIFEVVSTKNLALQQPIVGRGLATGDIDNDGRLDILVADAEGRPLLLHNQVSTKNNWLGISLKGTRSNRDGYGAIVTARAGKQTWIRHCHADGSYLSSSDPRVHFGFGSVSRLDSLTVLWPSGHRDMLRNPPMNRYLTLKEGMSRTSR